MNLEYLFVPESKEVLGKGRGLIAGHWSQPEEAPSEQSVKLREDKERLRNCHRLEETREIRQM